ncbi:MAG: 16S rRNA (guanine(527)-N(7))-methyltransferase RsmG [Ruminiclostridium sp.]
MEKIDYILKEFGKCNIALSQEQGEKLLKLYNFLVEYNEKVNLTAITDFEEVVVKHFVDSILPFSKLDICKGASFIDVGTGAGFPSIPLLIYRPDLEGTLLEALNKRCVFLEAACELVGVKAKVVHGRAEDYAKDKREQFDIATARAVAAMPVLCEYCLPYVKAGGRFAALKSINENIDESGNALKILGGKTEQILDYEITNGDSRRLFVIKKISQTPTKYPRNPSMIKKKPL